MTPGEEKQLLADCHSRKWRIENLYKIKDKAGNIAALHLWEEQAELMDGLHYLNIVLKARQRGMTTLIQMMGLDKAFWSPYTNVGIIAHRREDAEAFFDDKIRFAYDQMPEVLRNHNPAKTDRAGELAFKNGSRIRVGTSLRSGTFQFLHISEYGKLCAQFPEKASEVKKGALNTVAPGNVVVIESTAEGRHGDFYDKCMHAYTQRQTETELTPQDYKFFFFPWYRAAEYRSKTPVAIPKDLQEYFEGFEAENDVTLDAEQKYWYVGKAQEQGDDMHQEYPGTPEEAFERKLRGAIFAREVLAARRDRRIADTPHVSGVPVDMFWDLGFNDINSIWFMQKQGGYYNFIRYYEHARVDLTHYIHEMDELNRRHGYRWGTLYLPHDGKSRHIESVAGSAAEILRRNGFRVRVIDRPRTKVESIEKARLLFSQCRFDLQLCDQGLKCLEGYTWVWDEKGGDVSQGTSA